MWKYEYSIFHKDILEQEHPGVTRWQGLTQLVVPAELRGSLHDDGQQTDAEGEQPAETARHQAGPRPHLETAAADCRPSVDCQGNLDQEKGQETPVEKEGIKLTQDWVLLVVAKKYSITQRGQ